MKVDHPEFKITSDKLEVFFESDATMDSRKKAPPKEGAMTAAASSKQSPPDSS
ncbi:MAG: hypothetical protein R3F11_09200 [Verrucomicrobiales bacterium]